MYPYHNHQPIQLLVIGDKLATNGHAVIPPDLHPVR